MRTTRRELLKGTLLAGGALAATGCGPLLRKAWPLASRSPGPPPEPGDPDTRVLNRVTYGATAEDLSELRSLGREAYLERQLAASRPLPTGLELRLRALDIDQLAAMDLRDLPENAVLQQLQQAAILRAVYSPNQLYERMTEFWSDHFNIYARKGLAAYRKATDERQAVRRHAMGRFEDLLVASAHSTAMLNFLDNQANRAGGANENYARELMELHTLGVHGGYTQKDVQEVARCFTGWSEERRFLSGLLQSRRAAAPKGGFRFIVERHDPGPKLVLGKTIYNPDDPQQEGEDVLRMLAAHPSTAKHIGGKLCRWFLGDAGEQVQPEVERAFLRTGGDIRAMLRPILASNELVQGPAMLRRPFDHLCASLRASQAETDGGPALQRHLESMGQPLYQWPMPDGYPMKPEAWTGTLLARWNFALALCGEEIAGTTLPQEAGERLLPMLGQEEAGAIRATTNRPHERAALCLAAPGFQWK